MLRPQKENIKNVIIDIDDVIVNFAQYLCQKLNKIGKQAYVFEYEEYNFPQYHGLGKDDLKEVINGTGFFSELTLFEGVKESIDKLVRDGYKIHFVTARGRFDDAYKQTRQFLMANNIYFDTLSVVVSGDEKKSSAYKHLIEDSNEITIIDDNIDNLVDAHQHGVMGLCISHPWNQSPSYDFGSSPLWYFGSFSEAVDAMLAQ